MRLVRQITIAILSLFMINFVVNAAAFNKQELTQKFEKLGVVVTHIQASDINGLLEIQTSGGVIFTTPKGEYFIAGKLYKLNGNGTYDDVIAKRQAPINVKKINAFSDDMIIFKAKDEKYVVTVFTDITCGYCIKLHSQIQQYNDLGITIRYLAFPRQGGKSEVADQMAAVWCADDRKSALNNAKIHHELPQKNSHFSSCQNTIFQQYTLGRKLGVSGTPAIFLPNGIMLGGYLPPAQLLKRLQTM